MLAVVVSLVAAVSTVEPRFNEPLFNEPRFNEPRLNEPLFNEVLDITNDTLRPDQNYSKMYGIEPRYNELQCQHTTEDKR